MKFQLCSLILNEAEWIERCYQQHKNWPGLLRWVFVEAADLCYMRANPRMATKEGLSTDDTTELLADLCKRDSRIVHIKHGVAVHERPELGKVPARNRYLEEADKHGDVDFLVVVDLDEFYSYSDQRLVLTLCMERLSSLTGAVFKQRHIWQPPSVIGPFTFAQEVVGGYWDVPHARLFKWQQGMRYTTNHNIPHTYEYRLTRFENVVNTPQCIHMGFCASKRMRQAKHSYYIQRGETTNPLHRMYVDCRAAWEKWKPGVKLPHEARVVAYSGQVPEAFQ